MSSVHGHCDPAFRAVRERFEAHFTRHPAGGPPELGAAVSVVVGGRSVVDLWGGFADAARTRAWERDTLVMVASCTKGLTALVVLRLIEQGVLELDAPVHRCWPEYARHGKDVTTLRHLLAHRAGQPSLGVDLGPGGIWDWNRVTRAFADAAPDAPPDTVTAYHAFSFGHLLGEVVLRATGRSVGDWLRSDVAAPLGVDLALGMTEDEIARCAELVPPPSGSPFAALGGAARGEDFAGLSRYDDPRLFSAAMAMSRHWRTAGWPAVGLHTNARALARVYGALARGGAIDDVRLIGADLLAQATQEQSRVVDSQGRVQVAFGLGFQVSTATKAPASFGHVGGWGSFAWADPARELGFGYTLNQWWMLQGDPRGAALYAAARDCV